MQMSDAIMHPFAPRNRGAMQNALEARYATANPFGAEMMGAMQGGMGGGYAPQYPGALRRGLLGAMGGMQSQMSPPWAGGVGRYV